MPYSVVRVCDMDRERALIVHEKYKTHISIRENVRFSRIFHFHIRRREIHNKNSYGHNSITNSETIGSGDDDDGGGNGIDDDVKKRIPTYKHQHTHTPKSVHCSSTKEFHVCVGLSLCISRARTADSRERSESKFFFFRFSSEND